MRKGHLVLELNYGDNDGEECIVARVTANDNGFTEGRFYRHAGMPLADWVEAAATLAHRAGYVESGVPRAYLLQDGPRRMTFLATEDVEADEAVFTATDTSVWGATSWILYRQVLQDLHERAVENTEDGDDMMADCATFDLVLGIQYTGQPVVVLPNGRTLTLSSHSMKLIRHYVSIDEEDALELSADEDEQPLRGDITAELLKNRGVW